MLIYALTFAQKWNFTKEQAEQIPNQLTEALKELALKAFVICPHTAGVEQLFSSMEISNKAKNNPVLNNISKNTNFTELEDYDTLFSLVSNIDNDIEMENNEFQEIYTEFENSSDLFLEQLINFDVEELTLESNERENITRNEITNQ
ncbi:649_t:CDS:2 [Dentiscutata heterogama]|uniref:649_t:CDS:1 n=1 Tax=Dentiscutata heterogama TaxID=1316150 RepID=A0ACA9K529_9GLOM|nr:649_t:CDS:2 [Dentiscutata heterogama]